MMTILQTEDSQQFTALKQNNIKTHTKTLQTFRSKHSSIPQTIPEERRPQTSLISDVFSNCHTRGSKLVFVKKPNPEALSAKNGPELLSI